VLGILASGEGGGEASNVSGIFDFDGIVSSMANSAQGFVCKTIYCKPEQVNRSVLQSYSSKLYMHCTVLEIAPCDKTCIHIELPCSCVSANTSTSFCH